MRKKVLIKDVKPNQVNPRVIKDDKFKKLVSSIKSFPEMLEKRPIVVDENMIVLGGNMRLKASIEAGLKEVWIDVAEGWTEKQKKEFIIKDNVGFGEWDWDMLANQWDNKELKEWGMDIWQTDGDLEDFFTEDNIEVNNEEYVIKLVYSKKEGVLIESKLKEINKQKEIILWEALGL